MLLLLIQSACLVIKQLLLTTFKQQGRPYYDAVSSQEWCSLVPH